MQTYKAGAQSGAGQVQRTRQEEQPTSIIEKKSELKLPELRGSATDGRPRAFWASLWGSSVGLATQVASAFGKKIPAAVGAVVIGAAILTSGCVGMRGASLDMINPLPNTTIEYVSPATPINATHVAPVRQTDPTQLSGTIVRNSEVSTVAAEIASKARNGHASSTHFLPGNDLKFESWAHSYHTGEPRRMNILEAPSDGVVRGTIVVNVSGHSGQAHEFATSNTYSVRIELPDGTILERSGIPRNVVTEGRLPSDTPEYSTVIDIEYPYMRGVTKIYAWPDGSGGGDGYIEGRVYEAYSHHTKWDVNSQWKKSRDHKAAHPEIRWGTAHEQDDLEKHHVMPDPRPYSHYSNRW